MRHIPETKTVRITLDAFEQRMLRLLAEKYRGPSSLSETIRIAFIRECASHGVDLVALLEEAKAGS